MTLALILCACGGNNRNTLLPEDIEGSQFISIIWPDQSGPVIIVPGETNVIIESFPFIEDTTPPETSPAETTPADTTAPVETTPATPPATTPSATGCSHVWRDATCQAPKTCVICGATEGGLGGHVEMYIPAQPATCSKTGLSVGKKCSLCDTIIVPQEIIPTAEHRYGGLYVGKEATCSASGYNARKCNVCGYEDKVETPPTGVHEYVNGKCACGSDMPGTNGLAYELSSDGTYYICTGYEKYSLPSKIVIPSYYNGKPVKKCVGDGIIDLFDDVKEIVISEGIEEIGRMFFYCNGATTITIPDSVVKIHGIGISCKNLEYAYINTTGWTLGGNPVDLSDPAAAAAQLKQFEDLKWYTR